MESSQAMHVENIGGENSEMEQVEPLKGTILMISLFQRPKRASLRHGAGAGGLKTEVVFISFLTFVKPVPLKSKLNQCL